MAHIVLGISGASGTILGLRALQQLTKKGHHVHLVVSKAAHYCAVREIDPSYSRTASFLQELNETQKALVTCHSIHDIAAPIASGSYPIDGMIIMPCSVATLGALSIGLADNLLRRAADVSLKERRRLVIVPREAPLTEAHLENMLKLTRMGAIIVPPVPGWYVKPATLADAEEFIVGRSLDQLGIGKFDYQRWAVDEQVAASQ